MPLLGADPLNQAYHFLAGNQPQFQDALYDDRRSGLR